MKLPRREILPIMQISRVLCGLLLISTLIAWVDRADAVDEPASAQLVFNSGEPDPYSVIWFDANCQRIKDAVLELRLGVGFKPIDIALRDNRDVVVLYDDGFVSLAAWDCSCEDTILVGLGSTAKSPPLAAPIAISAGATVYGSGLFAVLDFNSGEQDPYSVIWFEANGENLVLIHYYFDYESARIWRSEALEMSRHDR